MTTRPDSSSFRYEHLPPHLAAISQPFAVLACKLASSLPVNPESDMALRKLLEAKDCAVRAAVLDAENRERQVREKQADLDLETPETPPAGNWPRRPNLDGG